MRIESFYFWLVLILRIALAIVFIYAGLLKIQNQQSFADSIAAFHLLPNGFINILALSLPPFEIVVGGMLLLGCQMRAASFSMSVLLFLFTIAFVQALVRHLPIDCGCFGSERISVWSSRQALGRDLLLLFAAIFVYFRTSAIK